MTTNIQWTDETWNPVRGCSRVSSGCDNCYAMGQAHRFSGPGKPYEGLTTIRRGKVDWAGMARLVPEALEQPLRWKRPRRIFVNSMSDLFHESLSNEEIAAVFAVMAAAPQHTFQVLTKRPRRMKEWFAWVEQTCQAIEGAENQSRPSGGEGQMLQAFAHESGLTGPLWRKSKPESWPLPNVWLGVSVEDQAAADKRVPLLLETTAAVRFVSAEPLLGTIDFTRLANGSFSPFSALQRWTSGRRLDGTEAGPQNTGIDWVIVGGESGPGARPCNVEWIRSIVSQCKAAGVPAFVKQLGAKPFLETGFWNVDQCAESIARHGEYDPETDAYHLNDKKGGDPSEWPEDLRVREFPG